MPDRTYLFVDGEYLRRIHRDAMQSFFSVDGDLDLSDVMYHAGASRAYFYDSLDDVRRDGEDDLTFRARLSAPERFFANLRRLSGFHVRLGTVTGQGKRRRQKEVDILLAVDMLTHGFNGSMQKAVLIAGDLDFRPIVETLVRNGVFVEVWYHHSSVAADLPGAADFGRDLSLLQLHSWNTKAFKEVHRLPITVEHAGPPSGEVLRSGTTAEFPVVSTRLDKWFNIWLTVEPGDSLRFYDTDPDLVDRYVAARFGPIKWEMNQDEVRETHARADAGQVK